MSASELRKRQVPVDRARLEEETHYMLAKARQAAAVQVQLERQAKPMKSYIEDIIGVTLNHKVSRAQLTKMGLTQLQLIVNDMHTKIERLNEHLVRLLVERDNMHMEQDSILVDIEDQLRHRSRTDIPLAEFLVISNVAKTDEKQRTNMVQHISNVTKQGFNYFKR